MFKTNDHVVYNREVCIVKDIKTIREKEYYVLSPLNDKTLTNYVPTTTNIRAIISENEVEKIIKEMPNIKVLDNSNTKVLEQEYRRLLNSDNFENLITIIKTCYSRNENRVNNGKKIGEKDDFYFKTAEKMLYTEFSIALNKSYDDTKKYIIDKLKAL